MSEHAEIVKENHVRYFKRCLDIFPSVMTPIDSSRMTILQLCLVGLAALGSLEDTLDVSRRNEIIEWIYAQQVPENITKTNAAYRGFRGGPLFGPHASFASNPAHNSANLTATYSALCALALLGDDYSRVDTHAITTAMRSLQHESGSFAPHPDTTEHDPRFIYSAVAVSYLLNDWSGIDCDRVTAYIRRCISYDGGITGAPLLESHGGHFYCCIASLALMDRLHEIPDAPRTLQWALFRQNTGYNGRINKVPDSCYSFWVGAAIEILGGHDFISPEPVAAFIKSCESRFGGLSKCPGEYPDPLHSALAIVGFSYCRPDSFLHISPTLLLPDRVVDIVRQRIR